MAALILLLQLTVYSISIINYVIIALNTASMASFGALSSRPNGLVPCSGSPADVAIRVSLEASPDTALHLLDAFPLHLSMAARFPLCMGPTLVLVAIGVGDLVVIH